MLTQRRLKELLNYDPATGEWRWINAPLHNTRHNGRIAGNVRPDGYRLIRVGGTAYYSGRLAFLYMIGEWPEDEVDHVDRNPRNDKWTNLRKATSLLKKCHRDMGSELRGVYSHGKRWQAHVGGVYLGIFNTKEEAVAIRDATAISMAGDFAFLNKENRT